MKREHLLPVILDGALAAALAFAGAACFSTGLMLDAELAAVARTALLLGLLSAWLCRLRWGGWLLLALAGIGVLWQLDSYPSFYAALHRILTLYDMGYGWGVPDFLLKYEAIGYTLPIRSIAAGGAMLAAWSLHKKWHTGAALAALLPVLPCIVLADTAPAAPWLLLAIGTLTLLALTSHTRRQDLHQANRLTALLLIPILLASLLLGQCFPKDGYQASGLSQQLFDLAQQVAEHLPFLPTTPSEGQPPPAAVDTVYLGNAGPQHANNQLTLRVLASMSGTMYLRGRSYAVYTGLHWEAVPETDYFEPPDDTYLISDVQTLQIQTLHSQSVTYFPYYVTDPLPMADGCMDVPARNTYLYRYRPLRADWLTLWARQYGALGIQNSSYSQLSGYLQLPEDTAVAAQDHLTQLGIDQNSSIAQITARIRSYVQNSAQYNVKTGRIPKGETDFAMWFLNHSETGYCIHFATAATVLLRAAGIPARYVEGYMVDVTAGQSVNALGKHAHAWAEYYLPHVGWVVLEATPGFAQTLPQPTEPTQPPTSSQPTEPTPPPTSTTQPTQPTQPSTPVAGPTLPPETSRPTVPTAPTEPTAPGTEPEVPGFDWQGVLAVLRWAAQLLALAAAIFGQWWLRIRLRRRRMAGRKYIHVRRRWRYACYLARLCGHRPPKPLLELLKKAKFSRHGLNRRELRQFQRYHAACIRGLRKLPWPVRLVLRLVLAAW